MKRFLPLPLLAALTLAAGCADRPTVVRTDLQRDSLRTVIERKDSLIEAVFADINTITENLARIKVHEQLISSAPAEGIERPIDRVNSDLAAIERLLAENRTRIASLQQSAAGLRRARLRIGELEQLIGGLEAQIAGKDTEIAQLRTELAEQAVEVQELNDRLTAEQASRREEVAALSERNDALDRELHAVCYIVGSRRKLIEAGIIDRKGFIGRTYRVSPDNSPEFFMQADSRELVEIPIRQKRVKIVTAHPESSYRLIRSSDRTVLKLVITDPVRFWESSRVLIVSHR